MIAQRFLIFVISGVFFGIFALNQENVSGADKEPQKLINLRQQFKRALGKGGNSNAIQKKYVKALALLKRSYEESGNPSAAAAVNREMGGVSGEKEAEVKAGGVKMKGEEVSAGVKLKDWLKSHEIFWRGRSGDVVLNFYDGQVGVVANGRRIMERDVKVVSAKSFSFEWSQGNINTFTFSADRSEIVRFIESSGNEYSVKSRSR